jgi:hypothetical protein
MDPTNSPSENIFKGVFTTEELSDYFREVETLIRTVEDNARAAEAQRITPIYLVTSMSVTNWPDVGTALVDEKSNSKLDEHSSKR